MPRSAGVLLNISSLPSPYGIGVFGIEAKRWIDKLSSMGFRVWQTLPFSPVDQYGSPYAGPSAFAGNLLYIDPEDLVQQGLLTRDEERDAVYHGSPYTAAYAFAAEKKTALLKAAFSRADSALLKKAEDFGLSRPHVANYALYAAIKEANGGKPWWEFKSRGSEVGSQAIAEEYKNGAFFHLFCQYLFFSQWARLRAYAAKKSVAVFGDMPIYVSLDSADVWSNPRLFLTDKKTGMPAEVAGVPPDYFSADGQLWGNPLYDWAEMEKDGFSWWRDRLSAAAELFDLVRIDHFRAFASYWAVPVGAKTAREGVWRKGPGSALFKAVKDKISCKIVAEDLGVFGGDVVKLLEETGFPGMRVIQFGFDPDGDSTHLPHNYPAGTVAYVGTHDNNTLLGWLWEATPSRRAFALDYCGAPPEGWQQGGTEAPVCRRIIETVWKSHAEMAIVAFQDMCGFGSDARMNTPGTSGGNWLFRTTAETIAALDADYFKKINRLYRR